MSIVDFIKIEEVDHVYVLKFRLVLEWYLSLEFAMTNIYIQKVRLPDQIFQLEEDEITKLPGSRGRAENMDSLSCV